MPDFESMARDLGNPDQKAKEWAAWGLVYNASHGADISVAIPALMKALFDSNTNVSYNSAAALECAAQHGTDISVAVPALVKALYEGEDGVREKCAGASAYGFSKETGMCAIMPALAKALCDGGTGTRLSAVLALRNAAFRGEEMTAATAALANALSYDDWNVRQESMRALEMAIEKCASVESLRDIEIKLMRHYGSMGRKCGPGKETRLAELGGQIHKLMKNIARRKNKMAVGRDIVLDTVPKPPKGGSVFRVTRRALIYG
jgi:hypothetical protein